MFHFSQLVDALPEGRQSPTHAWQKVFEAVFLGAAMQIPSLLQIEAECRRGVLAKRIGQISDDTIGYALQRQSPEPVFALGCDIARRLKRNGVLRSDWSRGLIVAAVDGIEICSSFARYCDACMQREVQHKVRGEMRTEIRYYHPLVAVVIVHARSRPTRDSLPERRRGRCRPIPPASKINAAGRLVKSWPPSKGHSNFPSTALRNQLALNQRATRTADTGLRNHCRGAGARHRCGGSGGS